MKKNTPPSSSSSGEEDSSSSEEGVPITKPPLSSDKPSAPPTQQVSSSEEEEEEVVEEPKLKLPSSTDEATTSKPKPTVSVPAPATTKRPLEGSSREDAKRVKTDTTAQDTSKKSGQRKWTHPDELALLEGMLKGFSAYEDTNEFFDSVKNDFSLQVRNVTKSQFMDKLYNLKKRYTGQGKDLVFTKPHDLKCVELAKSIWVDNGMGTESGKSNGLSRKNKKLESVEHDLCAGRNVDDNGLVSGGGEVDVSDWFYESFLLRGIAGFGLDERAVKQGWSLAPVEGKKRIKEEMKEFRAKEFEYLILKSDILKEAALMIAQVLKHQDI